MFLIADIKTDKNEPFSVITVSPKEFKTGSKGFFGMAKAELDGKRYQIQVQIVEIGSKPKAD
jgi:hypothetical protein